MGIGDMGGSWEVWGGGVLRFGRFGGSGEFRGKRGKWGKIADKKPKEQHDLSKTAMKLPQI